jgi:hypothetical protein
LIIEIDYTKVLICRSQEKTKVVTKENKIKQPNQRARPSTPKSDINKSAMDTRWRSFNFSVPVSQRSPVQRPLQNVVNQPQEEAAPNLLNDDQVGTSHHKQIKLSSPGAGDFSTIKQAREVNKLLQKRVLGEADSTRAELCHWKSTQDIQARRTQRQREEEEYQKW